MSPREKPKDPNDPREYLPVPHGGPILLGQAIIVAILTALCVGIAIAGGFLHARIDDSVIKFFAKILLVVGAGGAGSIFALWYRWMWRDASEYWLRNIRGYRLACFLKSDDSGRPVLSHWVIAPGNVLTSEGVSAATLVLPLGGWFPRTTIVAPEKEGYPWLWGSVQLRLRYPLRSLDDIGNRSVQITDRHGDRLTVTVQRALEVFEQHGVNILTRGLDGWQSAFNLAFEHSERFVRERDAVQAQLTREGLASEYAHRMWRNALGEVEAAIQRIKGTSRFGSSIEALRIRIYLLERFRDLVPTPRPEEPQLQAWCTWAEKELETARADLARRDRHRRRASAGAGA